MDQPFYPYTLGLPFLPPMHLEPVDTSTACQLLTHPFGLAAKGLLTATRSLGRIEITSTIFGRSASSLAWEPGLRRIELIGPCHFIGPSRQVRWTALESGPDGLPTKFEYHFDEIFNLEPYTGHTLVIELPITPTGIHYLEVMTSLAVYRRRAQVPLADRVHRVIAANTYLQSLRGKTSDPLWQPIQTRLIESVAALPRELGSQLQDWDQRGPIAPSHLALIQAQAALLVPDDHGVEHRRRHALSARFRIQGSDGFVAGKLSERYGHRPERFVEFIDRFFYGVYGRPARSLKPSRRPKRSSILVSGRYPQNSLVEIIQTRPDLFFGPALILASKHFSFSAFLRPILEILSAIIPNEYGSYQLEPAD